MKYVVRADGSNKDEVLKKLHAETDSFRKAVKKFGYDVGASWFEKGLLRLGVTADDSREYQPAIYISREWKSDKLSFKIQTTSFGSLDSDEYEEFINVCNMAYGAVSFMKSYDYSKFPEVEFEE